MKEKSIIAFFNSPEQAEQAMSKIKSLKVVDSSIDRVDGYPGDGIDHIDNPITGDIPSLGYLTLGGDFGRNAGILAAASVSASGMSSGGEDNKMTGKNICLTVVIEEQDFDQALQIVKDAGAEV